jgi:glycosyltransferase involved in cell wall biosynthesis
MVAALAQKLVSVVIPTWNRAAMVGQAIRSACRQSWPRVEVIVVDDGSTDGTRGLLDAWPNVTYVHQSHAGQAVARNRGLDHARGDYLATLDSDDIWRPDFLEKSVAALEQTGADLVFSNWQQQGPDKRLVASYWQAGSLHRKYASRQDADWHVVEPDRSRTLFLEACASPSSGMLFRRQPWVHRWNEEMAIGDDWCLLLDVVLNAPTRVAFTMDPLWVKRSRSDNIFDRNDPVGAEKWLLARDVRLMEERFAGRLTPEEATILGRHRVTLCLEAGRRMLLRAGHRSRGLTHLATSLAANPLATLQVCWDALTERMAGTWSARAAG